MPTLWLETQDYLTCMDYYEYRPRNSFKLHLLRAIESLWLPLACVFGAVVWGFAVYGFMRWVNG